MRKFFDGVGQKTRRAKEKVTDYWRRLFDRSNHHKMSEGAEEVNKIITSAHGDQWRRKDKRK